MRYEASQIPSNKDSSGTPIGTQHKEEGSVLTTGIQEESVTPVAKTTAQREMTGDAEEVSQGQLQIAVYGITGEEDRRCGDCTRGV
ncbi:hypothetical protein PI126_g18106 [Phytophthora idaei]|nr:hypothetical protein PI126_g18106 [Phytophthora idaei]